MATTEDRPGLDATEAWRRDLQQATGQYAEDAAELARRRNLWDTTRKEAEATTVAPGAVRREA